MHCRDVNLLALVLATTVAGLGPSAALPEPLPSNSYKLDNGLTVVLHLDRTVPLVAVRVLYRVGSADDPPGKQGMVHLMEHALFHGSEHLEGSVRNELGRMSAVRSNGVTTPDFMQLFELVPATNLSAALRLEADRMGFYEFDSIHLGTEKLIVNREMAERAQRSPWETVLRAAHTKLYEPTHSLHPASAETVAPISVLDLEDLAARALDPSNAVLALAGDLPSDTRDQVEQYFGGLDSTPVTLPKPPMPRAITAEVRLSVDGGHDTAPRVVLAWRAPRVGEPMAAVATLAAAVLRRRLRGGREQVWRHNADATGGIAIHSRGNAYGEFIVGASARAGTSPSALVEDLDDSLEKMLTDAPSERELEAARKLYTVSIVRQMDTLDMRAEVLAESAAVGEDDIVASSLAALNGVTADEVTRFVRQQLVEQPGRVVVLQYPGGGE